MSESDWDGGMTIADAAGFWDSRYAEGDQLWSGEPNVALVTAITDVPPGRALDLGCGEGGDTVWLARRGWQVTAVDVSATAVARARTAAADRHIPEGQVTWLVEDLERWQPPGPYDLVSACFLASPIEFDRTRVLQRAASSVTAGGHLLIVAHAGPPPWASEHQHAHQRFLGPDEELANLALDDHAWDVIIREIRPRPAAGPNGERANLEDTVVLARRR
ncbi:MAG TPA: class I SAM-dependent methyltransferase [Acidimicrobiales bacterium]|jgi:SAM-dependent methyltransferase|nr:class I SAM-dependent methyltransferase [Acidimicrobiales bacterium]